MGEIVGAALVSHVPTLVLPETDRRGLNNGEDTTLFQGLHDLRSEKLDPLDADTYLVFDSHWFTTIEHILSAHDRRAGVFTSEELPRGMSQVPYDMPGDRELAETLAGLAEDRDDTWITAIDDPHLPVHYPTINLLPFLQGQERWVSMGTCQTALPEDFLLLGQLVAKAVAATDRRVVLLASGGMSHRFWPLKEFRNHESADLSNIRTPEACAADLEVLGWMKSGDHRSIINNMDNYRAHAPEGRFGPYLTMAGALGGVDWRTPGHQFGEYEAVAGTGQAHVWFDCHPARR